MGYTHYWNIGRPLTNEEFDGLARDIKAIVEASDVAIAGWDGTGEPEYGEDSGYGPRIALNGARPNGHESFVIVSARAMRNPRTGFDFCKTRGDYYDVVVTASLLALRDRVAGTRLSSDGGPADWLAGQALAERALNRRLAPFLGDEEVVDD